MDHTHTGTTIVAMKFQEASGIVLAADKQCTSYGFISMHAKGFQKLHKITDAVIVAFSGSVAVGQSFVRFMRYHLRQYRLEHNQELRGKGVANLESLILQSMGSANEESIGVILGCYDDLAHRCELFSIGSDGSIVDDDYMATGSGSLFSYPYIKTRYQQSFDEPRALTLAEDSIRLSSSIDVFSGVGILSATLTANGIEFHDVSVEPPLKLHDV